MLAACLACLAVARGIAVDVDLGGQRATLSATANSLERVTSEGVAECGDSRFLRDKTWEEGNLPPNLIPMVKAMGMEPNCPTVLDALKMMSHDKEKANGESVCKMSKSELKEFILGSPMLKTYLNTWEPPDGTHFMHNICPATCGHKFNVGECAQEKVQKPKEHPIPGAQLRDEELEKLWKNLDRDGDGRVVASEIEHILLQTGVPGSTEKTWTAFLHALDTDGDHMISKEEFMALASTMIPAPPSHFHDGTEDHEGRLREAARKGIVPAQPERCSSDDKQFVDRVDNADTRVDTCIKFNAKYNDKSNVEARQGEVPCPFASLAAPMDFGACDMERVRTVGYEQWHKDKDAHNAQLSSKFPQENLPYDCETKSPPLNTEDAVTIVLWLGEWILDTDGGITSRTPNPASVGHAAMLLGPPTSCAAHEGDPPGTPFPRHALVDWQTTAAHFFKDTRDSVAKTLGHHLQYISWWPHELVRTQGIQSMTDTYPPEAYAFIDDLEAEARNPSWILVIPGWNEEALEAMREGWARKLRMLTKGYAGMDSPAGRHGKPRLNVCDRVALNAEREEAGSQRLADDHGGFHGLVGSSTCSPNPEGDANELYHILSNSCCHPVIAALRLGVMHLTPRRRREHVLRILLEEADQPYREGDDTANAKSLASWPLSSTLDNPEYCTTATFAMHTAQISAAMPPPDGERVKPRPAIMPENLRIASIRLQMAFDSYKKEEEKEETVGAGRRGGQGTAADDEETSIAPRRGAEVLTNGEEEEKHTALDEEEESVVAELAEGRGRQIAKSVADSKTARVAAANAPWEAELRRLFHSLDADAAGRVTKEALAEAIIKGDTLHLGGDTSTLLAALDGDSDGRNPCHKWWEPACYKQAHRPGVCLCETHQRDLAVRPERPHALTAFFGHQV